MDVRALINWASAGLGLQSETHELHEYYGSMDSDPSSLDDGSPVEYLAPPLDFGPYECARERYGGCPLANITLEELSRMGADWLVYSEYEPEYCPQLASHLIATNGCDDKLHTVTETDGRHRRCIAKTLQRIGVEIRLLEARH